MSNILYGTDSVFFVGPKYHPSTHLGSHDFLCCFFFVDDDFEARLEHGCGIVVEGSVEVRIG